MLTTSQKQAQAQQMGVQPQDSKKKRTITKDTNSPKKRRMELANSDKVKQNVTNFTSEIGKEWNEMSTE